MSGRGWRWTFRDAQGTERPMPMAVTVAVPPAEVPEELRERVARYVADGMKPEIAPHVAARIVANERRHGHGPEVEGCEACRTEMRST